MTKLDGIGILFFARLNAVLMGLVGFICGILYSFGGALIDALASAGWVTTSETPGLAYGTVFAFGALVGMPGLFALTGFAYGAVTAVLFNLTVKFGARWILPTVGAVSLSYRQSSSQS